MSADLLVPHALVLLELDDVSGQTRLTESSPDLAIAAAFFAELQLHDLVFAPAAHQVARRAVASPGGGALGLAFDALPDRPVPDTRAIGHVAARAAHLRASTLKDLEARGAVRLEVDRWFGLPVAWRWPTEDPRIEATLAERLRAHVASAPPELTGTREDCVLSLAEATSLLGAVWSAEELAVVMPRIRQRARLAPVGALLSEVFGRAIS